MAFTDEERKSIGDNFDFDTVARLKPGVSLAQAQDDVERVAESIRGQYPVDVRNQFEMHGVVMGLRESALGNYQRPLVIMMFAVVFVLLIAIANVANLLLAKGTARQRELSIRIALGAGARRSPVAKGPGGRRTFLVIEGKSFADGGYDHLFVLRTWQQDRQTSLQ